MQQKSRELSVMQATKDSQFHTFQGQILNFTHFRNKHGYSRILVEEPKTSSPTTNQVR